MSGFADVLPPPVPDVMSAPFWAACAERRLLVRHCAHCERGHYPPGPICPWCTSADVRWWEASGEGIVRSFVVFRHAFLPGTEALLPYTIVKVCLYDHQDAVLHGRLIDQEAGEVSIGQRVHVVWEPTGGGHVLPNWARTPAPRP